MTYDPIQRGAFPVGVGTLEFRDIPFAARPVPAEIWYPATDAYRGQDQDEATCDHFAIARGFPVAAQYAVRNAVPAGGVLPLFLYLHGGCGDRREASRFCTHIASHGYVVCSADFPGDNIRDLLVGEDGSAPAVTVTPIDEAASRRSKHASIFIDRVLAMELPGRLRVDADSIGTGGMSLGGFTSLALNSIDRRPKASFPMCPMFGDRSLVPQVKRLQKLLRVDDWQRPVPTCVLTGELDPMVNVEDVRQLYGRLFTPKRLVVLRRAGHMHFADNVELLHERYRLGYLSGEFSDPELKGEAGIALGSAMRPFSELCTEAQSGAVARGLCVAHLDAYLKGNLDARAFLDGDLDGVFAARGIDLETTSAASDFEIAAQTASR